MKILVLRGGAVGDFMVTLPVLTALRRHFPHAELVLAAYPRVASLTLQCRLCDRFVSLDGAACAALFSEDGGGSDALGRFDMALSFLHDPGGAVARNLGRIVDGDCVSVSPLVKGRHAVDVLAAPLRERGIDVGSVPALPRDALGVAGPASPEPVLAIHPGSGSLHKNWPIERYVDLADIVRRRHGWQVMFFLGEVEREFAWDSLLPECGESCRVFDDLLACARALVRCRAYLGNDSGISHLAAAAGVPSLVLFGPSTSAEWAPRGDHVSVLEAGPDLKQCRLETVLADLVPLCDFRTQ